MAEGLVRPFAGDRFDVASAGIERASVHPFAIRVMAEIGIVRAVAKASRIESDALELSSEGIVDRQDGSPVDSRNRWLPVVPAPTPPCRHDLGLEGVHFGDSRR